MDTLFSIVSFLVASSPDDETLVQEKRWWWEGGIVESVRGNLNLRDLASYFTPKTFVKSPPSHDHS